MSAPTRHDPRRPEPPEHVGPADLLAFCCELALLALLAVSGWRLGAAVGGGAGSVVASVVLLVALPAAAVAVWGRWLARTTRHRLRQPWRLVVQATLFVAAGALAAAAGLPAWGAGVAVVGVVAFALTREA
ncbi:DUF2568 domain-containing protein [Isoptericola sp. NPDC057559]|uniref:DUF2568 domain-containing protein n=1 Tax=Isoptericola sp. NPDC057559 TaxID=3346168 RepID=UPI00369E8203